jgi:hypothetical protein
MGVESIPDCSYIKHTSDNGQSTPFLANNVRHASLDECAVRAMQKKLKQSSDGGDSGRKEFKRGYGGAYGGVWHSLE